MDSKTLESGYRILSIVLVESDFKRVPIIHQPQAQANPILDIDIKGDSKDDNIVVALTISFAVGNEKKPDVEAKITMVGHFKKIGNPELPEENFANVNAPAIIYPFIREHLCNLTIKAGVGQILIPPLNFTRKKIEASKTKLASKS